MLNLKALFGSILIIVLYTILAIGILLIGQIPLAPILKIGLSLIPILITHLTIAFIITKLSD